MHIVNLTLKEANAFVQMHHRHSKPVQGHKFSIGVATPDGELIGVAIVGRPVARKLDDGVTAEVTRMCVRDGHKNLCSKLYRQAWSAWSCLGGHRLVTYTLASESGASLSGAGFVKATTSPAWKSGKGWTTRAGREWQPVHAEGKVRWELATGERPCYR
jgi:hypothetical protein